MPRIFWFEASILSLARWIGWSARAGVDCLGKEADHLADQSRTASASEKSAWVFRCVVSCVVIACEWAILSLFGVRADSPITLVVAWAAIVLLPKPTPRIPLVVARILAVVFTMANLAAFYDLAKGKYPTVLAAFGTMAGVSGVAIWISLSIWVLFALRSPARETKPDLRPAPPPGDLNRRSASRKLQANAHGIRMVPENRFEKS
jgi:hypothetical protein